MQDTDEYTGMKQLVDWIGGIVFFAYLIAGGIVTWAVFAPITGGF